MSRFFNNQESIARRIADGSIALDSADELNSMLAIFPDNPDLHKAHADLLGREKQNDRSAASYATAAELYLNKGMLLSAILCKISQWRINNPSHRQARKFFSDLKQVEFPACALNDFINQLSYTEMVALTNRMARTRLKAGQIIKKIGDPEDFLYLIASGTIRETTFMPLQADDTSQPQSSVYLGPNDVFGNIFPFEEDIRAKSFAESITAVEMGKISKRRLIEICRKYPNIAPKIIALFETQADTVKNRANRGIRRADRHEMPIRVELDVFADGFPQSSFKLHGQSRDISVGGVCCLIDLQGLETKPDSASLEGADVRVWLPSESLTLNVNGKVIWCHEVAQGEDETIAIGIQFKEMTPKMSGMLMVFADALDEGN